MYTILTPGVPTSPTLMVLTPLDASWMGPPKGRYSFVRSMTATSAPAARGEHFSPRQLAVKTRFQPMTPGGPRGQSSDIRE
jgi:hypothetical protein